MGGGRNKSKKFLKQKQAKQKKRSPQKVKSVGKGGGKKTQLGGKSGKPGLTHDDLASLSNSDIHFHKSQFDDNSEFSDNVSLVSELTIVADDYLNVNEQQAAYNELDEHFDNLAEKDAIMRQTALNTINHALRRRIFDDYLRAKSCDKLQTLASYLRNSLSKGDAREQCTALETCALVMLTLQGNHDILEKQIRPYVMRFTQRPHSRHVQIKSIETWTCMTWVMGDNAKTLKTIDLLDDIWMKRLSHKRLRTKLKEQAAKKQQTSSDDNTSQTQTETTNNESDNELDAAQAVTNKTGTNATYMKDTDSTDSLSDGFESENDNEDENESENYFEEKKNDATETTDATDATDATIHGSSNHLLTESQTDLLKAHAKKQMPENVAISAIKNWIWLIASIGSDAAIGSLLELYNLDFMDILEHNSSVELRCAAGQALTLLISSYKTAEQTDNKSNNNHNHSGLDQFDEILSIFYEFLEESNIKRKNLLKLQKRNFRDYLKTLENKWTPTIKIKLRGKVYEVEGWSKWIQYHCLKSILVSGFQPHLLENSTIQAAFDMENVEAPQPLTQLEKKSKLMAHADNAKQQKQQIKGQRQKKQAFMFNHTAE